MAQVRAESGVATVGLQADIITGRNSISASLVFVNIRV